MLTTSFNKIIQRKEAQENTDMLEKITILSVSSLVEPILQSTA